MEVTGQEKIMQKLEKEEKRLTKIKKWCETWWEGGGGREQKGYMK